MAGIYIHIPFCRQACHYCDFHFSTNLTHRGKMVAMIEKEIEIQRQYLGNETLNTIYFGGGSPSLLTPTEIHSIINTIARHHAINQLAEITLEANPDDLQPDFLTAIKKIGINRLSIGIQSFNNDFLKFLNRIHDSQAAMECINVARKAGFENISIDLIYGIPHTDHSIFRNDLEKALSLQTEHLSAYCLTIEPGTVFGKWQKSGRLKPSEDEFSATQFEMLLDATETNGVEQYEISNFCRNNHYSRHNTSYWKGTKYLGVGPGAHSYNQDSRQFNINNNHLYIRSLETEKIPFTFEVQELKDQVNDYILTSLRTIWGTDLGFLNETLGFDTKKISGEIRQCTELGLLIQEKNILKLTRKGKFLADEITSRLIIS